MSSTAPPEFVVGHAPTPPGGPLPGEARRGETFAHFLAEGDATPVPGSASPGPEADVLAQPEGEDTRPHGAFDTGTAGPIPPGLLPLDIAAVTLAASQPSSSDARVTAVADGGGPPRPPAPLTGETGRALALAGFTPEDAGPAEAEVSVPGGPLRMVSPPPSLSPEAGPFPDDVPVTPHAQQGLSPQPSSLPTEVGGIGGQGPAGSVPSPDAPTSAELSSTEAGTTSGPAEGAPHPRPEGPHPRPTAASVQAADPGPAPDRPAHENAPDLTAGTKLPDPAGSPARLADITASSSAQAGSAEPKNEFRPGPMSLGIADVPVAIAARVRGGSHHFELRLEPPELGHIEVHLEVDREGRATARLMADRSETLDLLRRDAAALERALQSAGLKTGEGGLDFSLRGHAFADRQHAETRQADEARPAESSVARVRYGPLTGASGRIDLRV